MRNYAGHRLAPWLSHVMVSRQETARQLITPGEIMQLPSNEELILLSGFSPIKAQKVRYYADKNFTGRVLTPPQLTPDGNGDLPPSSPCVWGQQMRPVDDRLYSDADKSAQDEIAAKLNGSTNDEEDAGGKDRSPELADIETAPVKQTADKTQDVTDADDLTTSIKLGEFVRGSSELARAHDLTRSTEIDLGM